ncbi:MULTISPECIES: flavin reductase family protein [Paenibacillus]|uniref:flavin reductase family protein n=1 Tax=Paenibacillus TaxID=44249 RepID=UPI0021A5EE77|nr:MULTISPECIES: flavin reductase family protein [unclassified Paenibacillus]MCT2197041.1 flavin reductase family protein [Paenibacillus sp. p3-SID1389]MDU0332771.1 flavin reductase family protein [Paenibacillus sp. 3LSP]
MEKIEVNFEKMYYGFPVILTSFYDENGVAHVTPSSSSYSLKDLMVLGYNSKGFAAQHLKAGADFVVNLPDRSLQEAINYCGSRSGAEGSKFAAAGLTPVASEHVNAPAIKECPISIACRVVEVVESEEFPGLTHIFGRIVSRSVAKEYLSAEGRLLIDKLNPVIYAGDGVKKGFRFLQQS